MTERLKMIRTKYKDHIHLMKRSVQSKCGYLFIFFFVCVESVATMLTQLTTGGKSDADIATPIKGPAAPRSKANATPVPDVNAQATPIHSERALPLSKKIIKRKKIRISNGNC